MPAKCTPGRSVIDKTRPTPIPSWGALVALTLFSACLLPAYEPAGRACSSEHPCPADLTCSDGRCVTSAAADTGNTPVDSGIEDRGGFDVLDASDASDANDDGDANDAGDANDDGGVEDGAADLGIDAGADTGCVAVPCLSPGLRLWLDPTENLQAPDGGVATWEDRSGGTITATQANPSRRPTLEPGSWNGAPAIRFDGVDDGLWFFLPIEGWRDLTIVFVVAGELAYDLQQVPAPPGGPSRSTALFWDEQTNWGSTFISPYTNHLVFRFGTTVPNNNSVYTRTATVGVPEIVVVRKAGPEERLRISGVERLTRNGQAPAMAGTEGQARLGLGYNNTPYRGRIGDLLIFDQALSDPEIQGIEAYLGAKYGLPGF